MGASDKPLAVENENVHPAVVVVVEEGTAATDGLENVVLVVGITVDHRRNQPGFMRHVHKMGVERTPGGLQFGLTLSTSREATPWENTLADEASRDVRMNDRRVIRMQKDSSRNASVADGCKVAVNDFPECLTMPECRVGHCLTWLLNLPQTMNSLNRRDALKALGAASAALLVPRYASASESFQIAGTDVEVQVVPVSEYTFRLSILPIKAGRAAVIPSDGSLVQASWGAPSLRVRGDLQKPETVALRKSAHCDFHGSAHLHDYSRHVSDAVQRLRLEEESGALTFESGTSPLLGLGEGGPQFDRRGSADAMINGQGGYELHTHGARLPIPWIVGPFRVGHMFIHQPSGTFDFAGAE